MISRCGADIKKLPGSALKKPEIPLQLFLTESDKICHHIKRHPFQQLRRFFLPVDIRNNLPGTVPFPRARQLRRQPLIPVSPVNQIQLMSLLQKLFGDRHTDGTGPPDK